MSFVYGYASCLDRKEKTIEQDEVVMVWGLLYSAIHYSLIGDAYIPIFRLESIILFFIFLSNYFLFVFDDQSNVETQSFVCVSHSVTHSPTY